jgi:hypothetical protein
MYQENSLTQVRFLKSVDPNQSRARGVEARALQARW